MKIAKFTKTFASVALFALAACLSQNLALAEGDEGNPRVLPPNSHPHGKTYSQWSAAWWQWAVSVPADVNPVVDETGAFASQGQSGSVWFLAGVFNSTGTAERTVTIPPGKALFFPIVNFVWISTVPTDPTTADTIRPLVEPAVDAATDLACEIDGVAIKNLGQYRTESPLFNVTVPANNIFGLDPGTYGPSMDEGYYLMLAPLNAGQHTIHFHGSLPTLPFTLDITYHITVGK